jgi:ubiquinone biosynthesis protein COQ4
MLDQQLQLSPDNLKLVNGFMAFANNPNQTEAVFDIADGLRHTDLYQQYLEHAHSQPAVAQIIQERYFAPLPNLEEMLKCPPQSLGYHYATEMKRTGLQPDFYRKLDVNDDYSYTAMRVRQTHDIWHIITGLDTDLGGEIGLQAFTLAQTRSPLSVTLLAGTIVFALKSSISLSPLVEKMQKGWQMGEKAKPFLAQKWEEGWEKPLSEWRADLKIESV